MTRHPHHGRTAAAGALLLAGALTLSACTGGGDEETTSDADATLHLGLVLEPTNLDIRHTSGAALEQILIDNVYEGLVGRTQLNELVPSLATSWSVSADGLTYTFTLADDVTFHNGDALTAADAAWSIQGAIDDETIVGHADVADVASVEAPDDTTLVLTLSQPNQNLLFSLSGRAGLVFDEEDTTTDLKTAANGSGPFTLAEWNEGDSIVLDRNDDYWGDAPGVAEIDVSYIPDANAGVNAVLDGSLDVLSFVDPSLVSQFDGNTDYALEQGKTTDKYILGFNNTRAPLDDVRVREALRLAIDHDALVEAIGAGTTQYGPIPELDPGYEDLSDVAPYDPEKAKELLQEAGITDLSLTLTIPNVYPTTASTFLVSAFNDIGVDLEVEQVEFSTWLQDVYTNGDYDLSFVDHVESRDFGTMWTDPSYYVHYDNAEVQDLYAQAMATTDADASAELLTQAARIVAEDHASDWLYTSQNYAAVATDVEGFPTNSVNARLDLTSVTIAG